MICKNCGAITFKKYRNDICKKCFTNNPYWRERLMMSHKAWKKFDWEQQERLTAEFQVILYDYMTLRKKARYYAREINLKNFQKGMKLLSQFLNSFSKAMNQFKVPGGKSTTGLTMKHSDDYRHLLPSQDKKKFKGLI